MYQYRTTCGDATVEVEIVPDPKPEYASLPGPNGEPPIVGPTTVAWVREFALSYESCSTLVRHEDVTYWMGQGFDGCLDASVRRDIEIAVKTVFEAVRRDWPELGV